MTIRFDRRVEAIFIFFALLGIAGRQWVLPQISWFQQLILFGLSLLILNSVWVFHFLFNEWLDRRLPLDANVARRVVVQLLGGWIIVKTVLLLGGFLLIDYLLPEISAVINRLNIIALGMGAFLANIVIGMSFIARQLFNRWQENLLRATRLEKEKAQVQYDNLKNQLNPHFLFNSLSSLDGLIHDNPELASQFLRQLSKVFRYVIQHKDRELVSLETELGFISNYVSLSKTRFDGAFQVNCTIQDDTLDRLIVPVTLQVLIENAIKHNTISQTQPLTVTIATDGDYLTVTNPIQRKRQVGTSNGQGLNNLSSLYQYLSPKTVEIQENGTIFTVRVPLLD